MITSQVAVRFAACFAFLAGIAVADFSFQNATLDLAPKSNPYFGSKALFEPANETYVSEAPEGNGPKIGITITGTARPIPEDQIFVGLIASLALIYDKDFPPAAWVPAGGFRITFVAGLQHAIHLEPLSGQRINWAAADSVFKALGITVFNKRTATEILFDVAVDGRRVARGGITNNPKMNIDLPSWVSTS